MGMTHRIKIWASNQTGVLEVPPGTMWNGIPLDMVKEVYVGGATKYPRDRERAAVPARTPTKRAKK